MKKESPLKNYEKPIGNCSRNGTINTSLSTCTHIKVDIDHEFSL